MFDILRNLLSDRSEGEIFTCFGKWHIALMVAVVIAIAIFCYLMYMRFDYFFR